MHSTATCIPLLTQTLAYCRESDSSSKLRKTVGPMTSTFPTQLIHISRVVLYHSHTCMKCTSAQDDDSCNATCVGETCTSKDSVLGAESRTNTTQMKVADEGTPWAGFLHGTAVLKLKNGRSRVLVPSHQRLSERVSHNALHPNLVPLGSNSRFQTPCKQDVDQAR